MHKMVGWIEVHYKGCMLVAMALELLLLAALVIIDLVK
jgi:hypothetical protein